MPPSRPNAPPVAPATVSSRPRALRRTLGRALVTLGAGSVSIAIAFGVPHPAPSTPRAPAELNVEWRSEEAADRAAALPAAPDAELARRRTRTLRLRWHSR